MTLETMSDFDKARELLRTEYSGFPADVIGALSAYIEATELFFRFRTGALKLDCGEKIKALEVFCDQSVDCKKAHTRLSELMHHGIE